jgi:hypothetical protein
MWWIVDVGFSHAIERTMQLKCKRNAYISIAKLLTSFIDLWMIAYLGEVINKKNAHEIWIYLNEKYGMVSDDKDGEAKEEVYEDVKHDHNLAIVEDCSSSWSSDEDIDERSTTISLDKIDGSISSDANHCYNPRTIDNYDCSCLDHYGTTKLSNTTTLPHVTR